MESLWVIGIIIFKVNFICSSLRVAEMVWKEGVLIKDFPPEAFTIKCLDDSWALLKQEDGQKRFASVIDEKFPSLTCSIQV